MGYICLSLSLFTFLATRTTPSSCFVKAGAPDSPGAWYDCECMLVVCNMHESQLAGGDGTITMSKPAHVPGGRRVVFSLAGAAALAYAITFAASLALVIVTGYSEPGAFIAVHLFCFAVSCYFAYDTQQIEERKTADQYFQGLVTFWADMVICIFCCICLAMMGPSN